MKKIQDLGLLEGELLIFGGPYSNLHALKALQKIAENRRIPLTNIICTGDIVAYCAFPDECVQFISDWGISCIAGNVEYNLREEADDCGCNFDKGSRCDLLSKQWFPYAKSKMSTSSMNYLHGLPQFIKFRVADLNYFVLHGSYEDTSEFIFKSTSWEIKNRSFQLSKADVILSGHSGLPFLDRVNKHTWINAGVIGIPANDGTTDTWFAILNEDKVKFERLNYDHQKANAEMLSKSLPLSYAQTLMDGIWDNCDILPEQETKEQGKRITLDEEKVNKR